MNVPAKTRKPGAPAQAGVLSEQKTKNTASSRRRPGSTSDTRADRTGNESHSRKNEGHHNNFDLIRLFAALMVVAVHMVQHGLLTGPPTAALINAAWQLFPGVQIFFIVSGFLLTQSWLQAPDARRYATARALRILPLLFVSTCMTSLLLWWFGFHIKAWSFIQWFAGQVTTLYVYHTPRGLAGFSSDMPNASVWTLPVEVQFYVLLPFVLRARRRMAWLAALMILSALMVTFNDFGIHLAHPDPRHTVWHHFWWFGLGVLCRLQWVHLKKYLMGCFPAWLVLHAALVFLQVPPLISAVTLAGMVLSAAHTLPRLARVLRGNDFSYGIYLFHRPYIHAVELAGFGGGVAILLFTVMTAASSYLSWHLLEQPCLKRKSKFGRCSKNVRSSTTVRQLAAE
jgi:peptidoglycan/LPS O-acetylase OafA/YrhL